MNILAALIVGWSSAAAIAVAFGMRIRLFERIRTPRSASPPRTLWLQQAGTGATPTQFGGAIVGMFVVCYAVLSVVAGPIVAFVPAAACAASPVFYYGKRRTKRLAAAQHAWPDALRDVLASIASGQSLHQALLAMAQGHHEPLGTAFVRYPALSRAVGTSAALEIVRCELADPVSDRVIEVFILAAERGGSIVRTILEDLTASISADLNVLNEIDTAVLESRINARAVVALPWVALVMINQGGGPFRAFYESTGGLVVVCIGALLTAVGWGLVSKLGRIPVEERVFSPGGAR